MNRTSSITLLDTAPLDWDHLPEWFGTMSPQQAGTAGVAALVDLYDRSLDQDDPPSLKEFNNALTAMRDRMLAREVTARTPRVRKASVASPLTPTQAQLLETITALGGEGVTREQIMPRGRRNAGRARSLYTLVSQELLCDDNSVYAITSLGEEALRRHREREAAA